MLKEERKLDSLLDEIEREKVQWMQLQSEMVEWEEELKYGRADY